MLSQMHRLSMEAEGRYATDGELRFLPDYLRTYELRMQTYQQLQKSEAAIFQQIYNIVLAKEPALFRNESQDFTAQCKRDTIQTLRYCAAAMLINDPDTLHERYALWLQTIVRAFNRQRSNDLIFTAMQTAIRQQLPAPQAELLLPLIQKMHQTLTEGM
jgi:hypothetical protein